MSRFPSVLVAALVIAVSSSAVAQADPAAAADVGLSRSGLPGLVYTGSPRMAPGAAVAATAGYGLTESIEGVGGAQHRLASTLAVSVAPLSRFAAALQLDGQLDIHPDDGQGGHVTGIGNPRLIARAGLVSAASFELGAELGVWLPGSTAPSVKLDATTVDGRALATYAVERWTLLAALGLRWDNSANAAPDVTRLRPADRAVLGLSDSSAVLIAVGLSRQMSSRALVFAELSADLHVGSDAPSLSQSPLRLGIGGRYRMTDALALEATAIGDLGARPGIAPSDPLMPIEPRLQITAGVRLGFGLPGSSPPEPPQPRPPQLEPVEAARPRQSAEVVGRVADDSDQPLPDAVVELEGSDGEMREAITDAEGRYRVSGVPLGSAELTLSASGFEQAIIPVEVTAGLVEIPQRSLTVQQSGGLLRGQARSFESEPLPARVVVFDRRGRRVARARAGADGRFEIALPPGSYEVRVDQPGYRRQRQRIMVDEGGVTILMVDLKR